MIKDMKSKGLSKTQIAEICDLDRKTVSKWIKSQEIPNYKQRPLVKSKLDDYKDYIHTRMNEGCLNATVIFDEIILMGYTRKMTILRVFMKKHREPSQIRATRRFETLPGKQGQVDWSEFVALDAEGRKIKYHAFVIIMGHSRKTYLEFTENKKMETLIGCHDQKTSNKKHFEGMIAWSQKKVPCTAPKLIPDRPPKVHQRPLSVYDSFLNEVIS